MNESPAARDDHQRVRELLGREPRGAYEIVVRDDAGDPVVLLNAPLLDDGTPMPTRYWLVGASEIRRIGQLEAAGGVNESEAAIDPAELAAAHDRYAAERDAEIPDTHTGPRPTGGVGGTRVGVKCLHAHWAWYLAGGDDPVGRWIADRLTPPTRPVEATVDVGDDATVVRTAGIVHEIPWGPSNLTDRWLSDHDPPRPDALTNALGIVTDHLDDLIRLNPTVVDVDTWSFAGSSIVGLARLEIGRDDLDDDLRYDRSTAEEVFRLVALESARERALNPGLPSDAVDTIIGTCCIVQACMRKLHLDAVTLQSGTTRSDTPRS